MKLKNQGGFYYGRHGKVIHNYGWKDREATEAYIAELAEDIVVNPDSLEYDDVGNVMWDMHTATPEEEGDVDGAGGDGEGAPEEREDDPTG